MKHDYRFIPKKSPNVRRAYADLQDILNQIHRIMRKNFTFQHKMVGSYSRNMITHDIKSNVGYDFDVDIYPNDNDNNYSPKEIKLLFKEALDEVAPNYGFDYAEDSTRVLTIKFKDRKNSRILHHVDFAFVNDYEDDEGNECQEYIHFDKKHENYFWNEQSYGFHMLHERIDWLKENGLWKEMKKIYIYKKNYNDDPNKHSRSLFAEAVNETYNKHYQPPKNFPPKEVCTIPFTSNNSNEIRKIGAGYYFMVGAVAFPLSENGNTARGASQQ